MEPSSDKTVEIVTTHPMSVDLQLLKDIYNVITVANQRCQWKMSELLSELIHVRWITDSSIGVK